MQGVNDTAISGGVATKARKKSKGKAIIAYVFGLPLIQPITAKIPQYSTYIVMALLLMVCIVWLVENFNVRLKLKRYVVICGIVLIHFIFNILIRPNENVVQYMINFIMYGALPLIFFIVDLDIKIFLKSYFYASVGMALIYLPIPVVGYEAYGMTTYMDLGFGVMLPTYIGLYLGRRVFKKKYSIILEIAVFLITMLYANRSCMLSIACLWILDFIFLTKKNWRHYTFLAAIVLIGIMIIADIKDIVYWINNNIFEKYGISSYAWRHIVSFVSDGNIEQLFTNRLAIYQNAINEIMSAPIIGHGPAYFESKYGSGYYAHNIILETAVESGVVVTAIVAIVLMYYYVKIIKSHDRMMLILLILFFCMCMPKLMLSNQVYKDYGFWMMIGVIMMFLNRRKMNENPVHR